MTAPDAGQPSAEAVEAAAHAIKYATRRSYPGLADAALTAAWPLLRRQVVEERDELLLEVARSGVEGGNDGP